MGNLGVPELILIFIIALIVFGPRKLPELGRNLGKALAEFRKHSMDLRMAFEQEMRELERHTREIESKATETLNPLAEAAAAPAALPEGTVGSGSIDPQQPASSESAASAPGAEESPREKPADGEPKPA